MKKLKFFVIFSFLLALILATSRYFEIPYLGSVFDYIAGPFFAERITPEDLLARYKSGQIKVLIVPGHDNELFGTRFKNIKEADLNLKVAGHLQGFLDKDGKFQTFITREKNGNYSPWLLDYIGENEKAIKNFRNDAKKVMRSALAKGEVKGPDNDYHNYAPGEVSLKLYAVNKWANDNNVDIVIHIHFNDYPGRSLNKSGEYSGFTIYAPQSQLPNARASIEVAKAVRKTLGEFFAASNLPMESGAVVEDQELIAVGSNATRDGVSLLIEYGYIYETQFTQQEMLPIITKELALQTYRGIKKYFEPDFNASGPKYNTALLPYNWKRILNPGEKSKDVLYLQAALLKEGDYPPRGFTLNDCPISGYYGDCTLSAVRSFQEKYKEEILKTAGAAKGTGVAGQATLGKLNNIYGS